MKHRECREAETQLRMIEERLGMTPTQYNMPPSPATMLMTELSTPPARTATSRRAGARAAATASASPVLTAPVLTAPVAFRGTVEFVNKSNFYINHRIDFMNFLREK